MGNRTQVNPACAGMIRRIARTSAALLSKPRVCGDDPYCVDRAIKRGEVNPACAGMILVGACESNAWRSKPRVCGDDPEEKPGMAVIFK